jgi:hypothetical protein
VVIVSLPSERVEIRPALRCAALVLQDEEERERRSGWQLSRDICHCSQPVKGGKYAA